jgi:SulP family sulfate permease
MFVPKSIVCLREGYSRDAFLRDVVAGIVVGIVALPLALAFAIASGVPPERGLYTAIVAGFLISALGGSRVQIGGPTGAFVVIVSGVVARHGYEGLCVATVIAGVILCVLGFARLGALIKFIPHPVITGFTSGIAVLIFSSQVEGLLGLRMAAAPAEFVPKWGAILAAFDTIDPATSAIAAGTILLLLLWPKLGSRVPGPFVAMVAATAAVWALDLRVETIGSRFGGIPSSLPRPEVPAIPWDHLRDLASPAVTIALLAAIESLLSAVVADGMIGSRHRSNMELVAQGIANLVSPLFGGIPATGAIARTATNVRAGGRTPVAGMVHAGALLAILLAFGGLAARVPLAALAAILAVVSYHMSEWRSFVSLFRAPKSDVAVLLVTFVLTVLVDLTVAVQVGVVASALLFMRRMAEVTEIEGVTGEWEDREGEDAARISHLEGRSTVIDGRAIPPGVQVYEVNGPFFFGAAEKLLEAAREIAKPPRALVLRMRAVPAIDATGLHALEQVVRRCRAQGTTIVVSEIRRQPRHAMVRSRLALLVGRANFASTFQGALARARVVAEGSWSAVPPPGAAAKSEVRGRDVQAPAS